MSAGDGLPKEIRGVMLPVTGGHVLLPSTTMAEVITYAPPESGADAEPWLLGHLAWRGWRLPVLAFAVLAGVVEREPGRNARVAVIKALGGHPELPYFGVLTQGFPRLTLISEDILLAAPDSGPQPFGVRESVTVHDEPAWIPDLAVVEQRLMQALARAA